MLVETYLQEKKAQGLDPFAELNKEFGIKVKDYPDRRVALLDYDQINSPKSHPIVIECRSLIVNRIGYFVESRKFPRFFNHGECPEFYTDFDFSSAVVYEKADGSLCGVWFNYQDKRWEISTRGMAFAEGMHVFGAADSRESTFREKILEAMGKTEEEFQATFSLVDPWNAPTFIFEYCSPENRVVTRYSAPHLVLLGITDVTDDSTYGDLQEWIDWFCQETMNVRLPKVYKADDLDSLVVMANQLENLEEGFVVHDEVSGKRVKIKAQAYVAAHRLRGNTGIPTRKNLLAVMFTGEIDEVLAIFPEFQPYVSPLALEVLTFTGQLMEGWKDVEHIQDQKEFALKVKDWHGSGIFFTAKKKGLHPLVVWEALELNQKLKLFGC